VYLGIDTWMAVTHATGGDTGEQVKILFTGVIVQILHAAFDHHDWLFVEGKGRRADLLLTHLKNILV